MKNKNAYLAKAENRFEERWVTEGDFVAKNKNDEPIQFKIAVVDESNVGPEIILISKDGFQITFDEDEVNRYFNGAQILKDINGKKWVVNPIKQKYKRGAKIKSHIYKRGKKINSFLTPEMKQETEDLISLKSNYPRRTSQWIWDNWTEEQRFHFLTDHSKNMSLEIANDLKQEPYENLTKQIKRLIENHILMGRYEHGAKIESQHEKLEYENVVNELRENASIAKIDVKPYGVEIQPYSPIDDAYMLPIKLTRHELLALYIESDKQFKHDNETILSSIESSVKLLLKK